ncbi:MAG: pilus assembly protein PilP [Acidobacteria bacterium]|nr:pilus assembly protein PilP [Acidobacteriota bacterium]MCG2815725.1 pilus assembly protein PilP [Candidatus Aminicenantes bacterium]MBU1338557.1 pilus assembly protein PilP [Acidobacteriota bacterium]MBU1475547.1 pilus assembly protein PilP [Acidobacteriota bacterium]MBU2439147.1 pilus assembly protein PilP [Acidobacteriota bacterium]
MRRTVFLLIGFFLFAALPSTAQDQGTTRTEDSPPPALQKVMPRKDVVYDPEGRRDPFKDLLGGADSTNDVAVEGTAQMPIDQVVISGILKIGDDFTAVIKNPQGFPYYVKKGDPFKDGYVIRINTTSVTFRKTKERGLPLSQPKDIVITLYDEEYTHEPSL